MKASLLNVFMDGIYACSYADSFINMNQARIQNALTICTHLRSYRYLQARDLLKIFKIKPTTFINYMTSVEVRKRR